MLINVVMLKNSKNEKITLLSPLNNPQRKNNPIFILKTVSPESECTDPKNVIADNESTIHKGSYDTKRYSQLGSLFEIFGFKVGEF